MTALSVHQEYNLLSHQHMSLPNCRHLPLHLTKCCLPTVTGPPLLITEDVPVSMTSVPGRPQHWVPNCKGHGASAEDAFLASRPHIPKHAAYLDPCTCAPRHSAPVASAARTHSGFSSPEMWSNRAISELAKSTGGLRSNGSWEPDRDPVLTGHRRASGLGPGCSKKLDAPSLGVGRKAGCLRRG